MSDVPSVFVRVPATSANLGPGFDTVGVALDRHLRLRTTDRADGPRVATTGHGEPAGPAKSDDLPHGDDNLVWSSFVAGCDAFGLAVPDLRLDAANDIPLERGLGSSSAAIVAGLTLARHLCDTAPSDDDVIEVATDLEGHPDNVAPAIVGGLVTAGRTPHGRLVTRRAQPSPALAMVAAVPDVRSRTSDSRGVLPDGLATAELVDQSARLAHLVGGMLGAWPLDAGMAGDCYHEPVRLAGSTSSRALLNAWRAEGVFAVLSGAGPTVAAIVERRPAVMRWAIEVAEAAAAEARVAVAVSVVGWDLRGAVSCPADDVAAA